MTASTHQLFGLFFGLIAISVVNIVQVGPDDPLPFILFLSFILIGALLPDLDTPHSRLGRRFPFFIISYPLYWLFGHRTWTHSFMFVGISFLLMSFFIPVITVFSHLNWMDVSTVVTGVSIGVLSHVLGDYFFDSGVPLFYPFTKKRYKFFITAKTRRPRSLNLSENLVALSLFMLNGYLLAETLGISIEDLPISLPTSFFM